MTHTLPPKKRLGIIHARKMFMCEFIDDAAFIATDGAGNYMNWCVELRSGSVYDLGLTRDQAISLVEQLKIEEDQYLRELAEDETWEDMLHAV